MKTARKVEAEGREMHRARREAVAAHLEDIMQDRIGSADDEPDYGGGEPFVSPWAMDPVAFAAESEAFGARVSLAMRLGLVPVIS